MCVLAPLSVAQPFFTIGHSTRAIDEFLGLLGDAGVRLVVDVRTVPGSRSNPQYNANALARELAGSQIGYEHVAALGGLRGRHREVPEAVNAFWRNRSFHNYADYAMGEDFHSGLRRLRELGRTTPCAIMCAEAVWWRCHRRIITDYLLADGIPVAHIMGHHRLDPAKLTPGARWLPGGILVYPAAEDEAADTPD